jgi:signal transduction histidine kinase
MMENSPSYKEIDLILAEKQKIIEKLQKENQSLLKIISHDIRAPFTQLFAMMQLLDLENDDIKPSQRHYFDRMYHSLASGMEMVKNLHDIRSLDQEQITPVKEEISLIPLIEKVVQSFHKLAGLKSIHISFEKGSLNPEVNTDSYLLEKILSNILSNAIKYPEEGTEVKIKLEQRGEEIIIIIEDGGPGIPESEILMVFEKYTKLSPKPSMGESTTGLGMYLAKNFVELIDGKLDINNISDNGGLRARISLPI